MDEKLWLPQIFKLHYEAGMESFPITGKICLLQQKAEMRNNRILHKVYFQVIELHQITQIQKKCC